MRLSGRGQEPTGGSLVDRLDVAVISPAGNGQSSEEKFVEVFHVTYCRCGYSRFGQLRRLHHKKLGLGDPVTCLSLGKENDPIGELASVESFEPTQSVSSPVARLNKLKGITRRNGQAAAGSGYSEAGRRQPA
jgi:hypothetical protein